MSNAEKIRLITCAMGPSSDWHRDPERFERVINLSKKLGMYKVSDTKQKQLDAIALYNKGWDPADIANEVDLRFSTINKIIKEHNR